MGTAFLREDRFAATDDPPEIVSADVAVFDPGVSVAGENAQFQPLGRPAQESDTGLLNEPDCGFAVTISFPVLPAGIMTDVGDALRVKVGGGPPPALHEGV